MGRDNAATDAEGMLRKPYVPMEEWSRYIATISIDGNGLAGRLPQQVCGAQDGMCSGSTVAPRLSGYLSQFLAMSPLIKVNSPVRVRPMDIFGA